MSSWHADDRQQLIHMCREVYDSVADSERYLLRDWLKQGGSELLIPHQASTRFLMEQYDPQRLPLAQFEQALDEQDYEYADFIIRHVAAHVHPMPTWDDILDVPTSYDALESDPSPDAPPSPSDAAWEEAHQLMDDVLYGGEACRYAQMVVSLSPEPSTVATTP